MKYLIGLTVLCFILLCGSPVIVGAATPTPTLRPIPPTPTPAYLYFRPTPTLWSFPPVDGNLNISFDNSTSADVAINTWRWLNKDHLLDLFSTGALLIVVLGLLLKIASNSTKEVG